MTKWLSASHEKHSQQSWSYPRKMHSWRQTTIWPGFGVLVLDNIIINTLCAISLCASDAVESWSDQIEPSSLAQKISVFGMSSIFQQTNATKKLECVLQFHATPRIYCAGLCLMCHNRNHSYPTPKICDISILMSGWELQLVTYKQTTPRCVRPLESDALAENVSGFYHGQKNLSCLKQWIQSGLSEGNVDGEEE